MPGASVRVRTYACGEQKSSLLKATCHDLRDLTVHSTTRSRKSFCGELSATKHHASQRLLRRHHSCARKKPMRHPKSNPKGSHEGGAGGPRAGSRSRRGTAPASSPFHVPQWQLTAHGRRGAGQEGRAVGHRAAVASTRIRGPSGSARESISSRHTWEASTRPMPSYSSWQQT